VRRATDRTIILAAEARYRRYLHRGIRAKGAAAPERQGERRPDALLSLRVRAVRLLRGIPPHGALRRSLRMSTLRGAGAAPTFRRCPWRWRRVERPVVASLGRCTSHRLRLLHARRAPGLQGRGGGSRPREARLENRFTFVPRSLLSGSYPAARSPNRVRGSPYSAGKHARGATMSPDWACGRRARPPGRGGRPCSPSGPRPGKSARHRRNGRA